MNEEEVEEYVGRSRQVIEASPQMNEENTKVKLVQPLLRLLGWDLVSAEVELEYTIPMASGSTHVDYALLVGDSPVVFVEAKPVRSELTAADVRQLKSYMRQELDVDWGILTNGKEFEVLTKSQRQSDGEEVSVARFDLDDLGDDPDVLELLSKESIRSGRSDEIARQIAEANEAIRYLQDNENDVTETVANAVEREVGDVPLDLVEQSREFVQNLTDVLREQRQFVSEDVPSELDETAEDFDGEPDVNPEAQSREIRGYHIRFSDGTEIPGSDQEIYTQQKRAMGEAINHLIEKHELIDAIELPHFPPNARKNCSINSEPIHPNGEEMRGPYELTNGYYLHTSLNTKGKKNRIRDLAEQVGLSVEFLGEW